MYRIGLIPKAIINERYEKLFCDIHIMLPTLDFSETEAISLFEILREMYEYHVDTEFIKLYFYHCSSIEIENYMTVEWCNCFIAYTAEKDRDRRKEKHIKINSSKVSTPHPETVRNFYRDLNKMLENRNDSNAILRSDNTLYFR